MNKTFNKLFHWHHVDIWGSIAGFVCAVHCLSLPYLILFLPLNIFSLIDSSIAEWILFLFSFSLGFYSLFHSFIHHHSNYLILILFFIGFSLLLSDRIWISVFHYRSIVGGFLLCIVHYLNWKYHYQKNRSCSKDS